MRLSQHLRPMSMGELFDIAFWLYRAHFSTFVGITAVVLLPMTIVQLLFIALFGTATFITLIQITFSASLISAALARTISRLHLNQPISIGDAYRFGVRRYISLIWAQILEGLILINPLTLIFVSILGSLITNATAINLILLALFTPIAAVVIVRFLFVTQGIVLEGREAEDGLRRSWRLTEGSFWRIFVIVFCLGMLSFLISTLPTLLAPFLITFAGTSFGSIADKPLTTIVSQVGFLLVLPPQLTVYTLLYYDLRMRKEGYDIALLTQRHTKL